MWQHMFCVSVMCSALRRERIPDDVLERSKHVVLFLIKVF